MKRPWKDEIRQLLGDKNIDLKIEEWKDAEYKAVQKEEYWPGNLARRLREEMEEQNIDSIDFSPQAFTERFNERLRQLEAEMGKT